MKKKNHHLPLLLLCFLAGPLLHSQPFLPVLQENNEWSLMQAACDLSGGIRVWLQGDSSLNGETYKKVWAVNCGEPQLSGFLREDTNTGRLWFRQDGQSAEKFIMDLSLQQGDTFYFDEAISSPSEIAVEKVETIDGRRVVSFSREQANCITGEDLPIRFIEGIGPSTGFFYPTFLFDGIPFLLACVHQGDSLLYQEAAVSGAGCDFDCITTDAKETRQPAVQLTVSPNPFTESTTITITGLSQRAVYFSLFEPSGRLLRQEQLLPPTAFELKRGALPAGLYFFRAESDGNILASGRVVAR